MVHSHPSIPFTALSSNCITCLYTHIYVQALLNILILNICPCRASNKLASSFTHTHVVLTNQYTSHRQLLVYSTSWVISFPWNSNFIIVYTSWDTSYTFQFPIIISRQGSENHLVIYWSVWDLDDDIEIEQFSEIHCMVLL